MANRKHPVLTALRVTAGERAMIDAVAKVEQRSVSQLLREIVLPAVGRRASEHADSLQGKPVAA